jgi:hypothetical protein
VVKDGDHLRQAFPKLYERHGALITELFEEIWSKLCSESEVRSLTLIEVIVTLFSLIFSLFRPYRKSSKKYVMRGT